MGNCRQSNIGIYVRISRDDSGENHESIENQRDLLLEYVSVNRLGRICGIYVDDNVSGSAFEREGLDRLKRDISAGRIDLVLLKDLSRLGRNNAKTLQMIDYLEECGVRLLTADGRYDSLVDNDTVGIETWVNERYVRDISRKIRACLRFKIQRGEYLGRAPFGYRKSDIEKNKLVIDEAEAYIVKIIYSLYISGHGYSSISKYLEKKGYGAPRGEGWNRITVRRILCSRVYIGDTVQGVSEKVSFKSKKTRRLPQEKWVITEGTHEAIISREAYEEVQRLRNARNSSKISRNKSRHILNGIMTCGDCGSTMYARKRRNGTAYVCGNYCRKGKAVCSSHFVYEDDIVAPICRELAGLFEDNKEILELQERIASQGSNERTAAYSRICTQLEYGRRQQELLYKDRLEGRISEQLFERMNLQLERRLALLEGEVESHRTRDASSSELITLGKAAAAMFSRGELTHEMAEAVVSGITVYEDTVVVELKY
ncbi:MAG: recombinase family protein [Clostridiaceae bacterium]|nr:recombinase family protein [Clostridiaceae bacterium]